MNNNLIKRYIDTAYRNHELIQNPIEIYNFAKFYSELNCKNVLEIGTFYGGTFYLLCKLSNDSGKKVSVDFPYTGTPGAESVAQNLSIITKNLKTFASNVEVLTADSHSPDTVKLVEQIFNGEEVDFIFIDGDHSYEGVKNDYQMYKHLVKDGGYIAFHDIIPISNWLSNGCEVDKFWQDLLKDESIKTFEFNQKGPGGIGVVQVFKHKKKLDISVSYTEPNRIDLINNSHSDLDLKVSIRDKHTKIPIYYCDMSFTYPGQGWYIRPLGGDHSWMSEKHFNTFLIEFYDKNENLIDSKELKIKEDREDFGNVGTRHYYGFDCLWINYKQMFIEKIYDRFDMDNLNTVIDIGANVGIFSNYISTRNAKVIHAIEPTQRALDELKKQFYYYNSVKSHKIGIGPRNEKLTIYTDNDNTTISNFNYKTSGNCTEEVVDVLTLPTFYEMQGLTSVDLVKIDIEGMEYDLINSLSDADILRCSRYLIEYHINTDGRLDPMLKRFEQLGYDLSIHPDVESNVQGHFFAKYNPKKKIIDPSPNNTPFPKKAFVTFTNEYYLPITEKLVKSVQQNSNYPIIVYSVNCDVPYQYPHMFTKRIDSDIAIKPKFSAFDKVVSHKQGETVEVISPEDTFGIVDRNDLGTYVTLSRKPLVILDAINNGLEEGIFLDADGIAKENIDSAFDYLFGVENYPLVGKGLYEYMMLNGLGDPAVGPTLEQPLMDLLGVTGRTMPYVATNFILFTSKMKQFIEEWASVADRPEILKENVKYAPYHDETIINVLLWKYKATKQLPLVHYNLTNAQKAQEFYTTTQRGVYTDSDWHYIPKDIDDIKYFHGCKSLTEIDKTLDYIESRKERSTLTYRFKHIKFSNESKVAIVTLFDDNYQDLANVSIPNFISYAAKHGHDLIFFDQTIDTTRPPQWSKVKAVRHVLSDYDWVWWLDIDALIMNHSISLTDIIDENYDIIFTKNKYSVISNGSSFFKNTELTIQFLDECYTLDRDILRDIDIQTFDHEQKPMRTLYLNAPEYTNKIKLIHERVCNSYWYTDNSSVLASYPNWNSEDNIYQPGDFVVNFCGRDKNERVQIMKEKSV